MLAPIEMLNDTLVDFWTLPAPKVTRLLPADNPLPPRRTTLDFLIQLFWETERIQDFGPSFLGPHPLLDDSQQTQYGHLFFHAHDQTEKALAINYFDARVIGTLQELPSCIRKCAAYHDAIFNRYARDLLTHQKERQKADLRLWYAKERRDGEKLLSFYPYEAPILYDDGETDLPEPQGKVYPLVRRRMARELEREVARNNLILFQQAEPIEELNYKIDQAVALTNRSGPLRKALTLFAQDVQSVLETGQLPVRPNADKIIALSERSGGTQRPHLRPLSKADKIMRLRPPMPSWRRAP